MSISENILLKINPSTRAITYDGTNLILGVKEDDCAQKIYFECPLSINDVITDLDAPGISIYVEYKNAANETYKQDITSTSGSTISDSTTVFSWLITNNVTYKAGNVSFNICIQQVDENGKLKHEWHTTPFIGKVLDKVTTSNKTPEVITHDTHTLQSLLLAMSNYITTVNEYKEAVASMNEYIDETVLKQIGFLGDFDTYCFDSNNDYLAEVTTPGIYTFTVTRTYTGTRYFVLVVDKNAKGLALQSVFGSMTTIADYETRYRKEDGTWSESTKSVVAVKSDLAHKYFELNHAATVNDGGVDLEGNFILTVRQNEKNGPSYTDILTEDETVIMRINWDSGSSASGITDVIIKGYKLDELGTEYAIECSSNSNTDSIFDSSYPPCRIMDIYGGKIFIQNINGDNEGIICKLITNI